MQGEIKYLLKLLIIVLFNICVIGIIGHLWNSSACDANIPALSRIGSRGNEVSLIQQRLNDLGYNAGNTDGVYNTSTSDAVKAFQADHGLTIDGVAGPVTLQVLGLSASADSIIADSDYYLLARLISAESQGEPYPGQVAVGAVILNRVQHPSFPDSIAGVAYQPGAFASVADDRFERPISQSAYRAAKEALNGSDPSGGAIYYYDPDKSPNKRISSRPVIKVIGKHRFCG